MSSRQSFTKRIKNLFVIVLCFTLVIGVAHMPASADDAYNSIPAMADAAQGFVICKGAAFQGTFGSSKDFCCRKYG